MKIIELIEAFVRGRKEKGEVPFRKSSLTDAHIRSVIVSLSTKTGVPVAEIEKDLVSKMDKFQEVGKYSPMLYDTLIQNAAENAAFNHISESVKLQKLDISDVKFNEITFKNLVKAVQRENPAFFPLKPRGEIRMIYQLKTILVPDPRFKMYDTVKTAAATPGGDFVFNKNFMQQLLYYAGVSNLKPKSAKYECNGGPFPDGYAYIEFLIMHELLHYAYGDFATGKRFSQYSHKAHNWAMDFRSNYMLVKSGYEQLPVGLFSDDLNFDRELTSSYPKLIKVLDQELKKLPKDLEAWVEQEMESDIHGQPPLPPEPWKPTVGEIVLDKKTGTFIRIEKINNDGTVEANPIASQEVEELKKSGVKVG